MPKPWDVETEHAFWNRSMAARLGIIPVESFFFCPACQSFQDPGPHGTGGETICSSCYELEVKTSQEIAHAEG